MDDERLKEPDAWDHFDELLERIREIRASEKRFYRKVRDLFKLSSDYAVQEKETDCLLNSQSRITSPSSQAVSSHRTPERLLNFSTSPRMLQLVLSFLKMTDQAA